MAAEVVTAEVWGEQVDPEVYEECQVRPLRSADVMTHLPVVPACLPACLPARLPACPPARLPTGHCHVSSLLIAALNWSDHGAELASVWLAGVT
jgi:hypothetical protein